jgi:broad specificity phosphatase PhoE
MIIDWIRHAESCKNRNKFYKFIPPVSEQDYEMKRFYASMIVDSILSHSGLQQAVNLGELYIKNTNHDFICTSAVSRTLMTSLLASRDNPNIKKIYVLPYMSEKHGDKNDKTGVPSKLLRKNLKKIFKLLKIFDDQEHSYPEVDFSILCEYEQIDPDTQISNKEKLYKLVKTKFPQANRIACFSHGHFIRYVSNKTIFVKNTFVIEENNGEFKIIYTPINVENDLQCNTDTCDHQYGNNQKQYKLLKN